MGLAPADMARLPHVKIQKLVCSSKCTPPLNLACFTRDDAPAHWLTGAVFTRGFALWLGLAKSEI
jgi:hypothetical protein